MKRRLVLALTALLTGMISMASADYVIIIANLGVAKEKAPVDPMYDPGGGTLPGGKGGIPLPGGPSGTGGAPLPPGPGGLGGAPPPPGPGGLGGYGMRGGGFDTGSPDGYYGPGGLYGPGGFAEYEASPLFVMAVIETRGPIDLGRINSGGVARIEHKWGNSYLFKALFIKPEENPTSLQAVVLKSSTRPMPNVQQQYTAKRERIYRDAGGKPSVEKLLELARWSLEHGLMDKFTEAMEEVVKVEPKHPAAVAYRQVQADMDRPLGDNDGASAWTEKDKLLQGFRVTRRPKEHYTLLHKNTVKSDSQEVKDRLDQLEKAYRGFYYWFALKEIVLPQPEKRLLAVLLPGEEFESHYDLIFNSEPLVADGFYARRDNLIVMSAESQDAGLHALSLNAKPMLDKINRDKILKYDLLQPGVLPQLQRVTGLEPVQMYEASMKALLLHALEEDVKRATITHEVSRQLLAAAKLLPRNVAAPEWVQFGVGSFFETPKGSPWTSVGAPSQTLLDYYNYLALYKQLTGRKKATDPAPTDAMLADNLKNVVTDGFFRKTDGGKDKAALQKARAMSWALTYYLAHDGGLGNQKLDGLRRYFNELSRLPRDLEFDDKVLLNCFARAFGLVDTSNQVDKAKFTRFAVNWNKYMQGITLEVDDGLKELKKVLEEIAIARKPSPGTGAGPTGPGGPGGPGGAGQPGGSGN